MYHHYHICMRADVLKKSIAAFFLAFFALTAICPTHAAAEQSRAAEPNEQETIQYIHNWFQRNVVGKRQGFGAEAVWSRISFSGDTLEAYALGEKGWSEMYRLSNINWSLAVADSNGKYLSPFGHTGYVVRFSSDHIAAELSFGRPSNMTTYPTEMKSYTDPNFIETNTPNDELAKLEKAISHLVYLKTKQTGNSFFDN